MRPDVFRKFDYVRDVLNLTHDQMVRRCHVVIEADWELLQRMSPTLSLPHPRHRRRSRRARALRPSYYSSGDIAVMASTAIHDRELMARRAAELGIRRANRSMWTEAMVRCVAKVAGIPLVETTAPSPQAPEDAHVPTSAPAAATAAAGPAQPAVPPAPTGTIGATGGDGTTEVNREMVGATIPTPPAGSSSDTPDIPEDPAGADEPDGDTDAGVFIPEHRWKSGSAP